MERTHIPSSPACGQWETLLADALDGQLRPEDEATFSAHMASCSSCIELFEQSRQGREWLEFLSPEPEVPEGLLDRILAQTGPGQVEGYGLVPAAAGGDVVQMPQPWQRPGFLSQVRRFAEPRLLMTAAMAFFSIALTLNLAGVRVTDMRLSDLRPAAMRSYVVRQFTVASTPIVRYYDHLRFVYEVQTRMREMRRTQESIQQKPNDNPATPGESKHNPSQKDGGSRVDPLQQSVNPGLIDDILESSLTNKERPAHSGGSATEVWERSTQWTA
jgi:hypothetical protein